MKKTNLIATLSLAAVLMLGGCSGGSSAPTAEQLMTTAETKMAEVTNFSATMSMIMNMSMGEESVESATAVDMLMFSDPVKMKMTMSMDMGELGVTEMDMYMVEQEDQLYTYAAYGSEWIYYATDASELAQYDAAQNTDMYLSTLTNATVGAKEDINGMQAYRIDGVITDEDMEQALVESGALGSAASFGLTEDQLLALYKETGDLPMALWITDDGYVVRYVMDMTALMQNVMGSILGDAAELEGFSISIDAMQIDMTMSNFNQAEDFELPAEAANATLIDMY